MGTCKGSESSSRTSGACQRFTPVQAALCSCAVDHRETTSWPFPSVPETIEPTERDRENARIRQAIADVQERQWQECYLLALGAFGPGWLPSGRHFLVAKDEEDACRKSGAKPKPAATVYTVKKDGQKRHFTVEDGTVVEHDNYEAAFGAMLLEPHPTQTMEVRGEIVHPHRYSLCFAAYERYHPRSAKELAALRASRGQKRDERDAKREAREFPLFVEATRGDDTGDDVGASC